MTTKTTITPSEIYPFPKTYRSINDSAHLQLSNEHNHISIFCTFSSTGTGIFKYRYRHILHIWRPTGCEKSKSRILKVNDREVYPFAQTFRSINVSALVFVFSKPRNLRISQGMPSNDTISYSFQPLKSLKETCRAEFSSSRLVLPLKILASTRGTQGETPPKPIDVSFTVIIPYLCIQVPVQVPVQAYVATYLTTNGVREIRIMNFKSKGPRGISISSNISKYQRQCVSIRISIRILKTAKHAYFTRNALKRHHQLLLSATRRPLNSAKSRYCGPKQLQTTPLSPKCIGVPTRPPTSATRSIWAHFTSNLTSKPRKHTRWEYPATP